MVLFSAEQVRFLILHPFRHFISAVLTHLAHRLIHVFVSNRDSDKTSKLKEMFLSGFP
jgi:hypothetical protein